MSDSPPIERKKKKKKGPSFARVTSFLTHFGKKRTAAPVAPVLSAMEQALADGDEDTLVTSIAGGAGTKEERAKAAHHLLTSPTGRAELVKDPKKAGEVLAMADPKDIDADLLAQLGKEKDDIFAEAVLSISSKRPASNDGEDPDRRYVLDPELFKALTKEISKDAWNDTNLGMGAQKRGLGPRVLNRLAGQRCFDQICDLIDLGVDTTTPAVTDAKEPGSYSGFVMPLQHKLQEYLHETAKVGTDAAKDWSTGERERIEGMKMVLDKLEKAGKAEMVTSWKQVTDSELIKEFDKNPGTIWGFENVRAPFVEASHEKDQGKRPVRMMELWDAIEDTLSPKEYAKFIDDPASMIDSLVKKATDLASAGIDSCNKNPKEAAKSVTHKKFLPVRDDKEGYLKFLAADARKFLTEFAKQMPKGSMSRASETVSGKDGNDVALSNVAGTDFDKFMSSFACQAGLWNAKANAEDKDNPEVRPVYYCLDGIKMDDVIDYKKAKYKAIEEFLADGGIQDGAALHKETVTMKEVREILRSWNDLKFPDGSDVVRFVRKGSIMKPADADKFVKEWDAKMKLANEKAGRRPAPKREVFAKDLEAIDKGLAQRLDDAVRGGAKSDEIDKDARDIVKKAGYLLRVSKTNPEYVVKYLMSKCEVLITHGLVPKELVAAAAALGKAAHAEKPASGSDVKALAKAVQSALDGCAPQFKDPLSKSLLRHPLVVRAAKLEDLKADAEEEDKTL